MKILFFLCFYYVMDMLLAEGALESNGTEKKVKGQKLIHQTMSAKVIDGEIPKEVLSALLGDTNNSTQGSTVPDSSAKLLAENIKTTITRYTIPLSTNQMHNEWYRTTLRKFLSDNHINLIKTEEEKMFSNNDKLTFESIQTLFFYAQKIRSNLLQVLFKILHKEDTFDGNFGEECHSALLLVYKELLNNNIHVVDIVDSEALNDVPLTPIKEQLLFLFEILERYVPKYLKSSVTFWLQGIQQEECIKFSDWRGKENELDILSKINLSSYDTQLFPQSVIENTKWWDVEYLGTTIAYTFTAIGHGIIPPRANVIGLVLQLLPVKIQNYEAIEYAKLLENSDTSPDETCFKTSNVSEKGFFNWRTVLERSLKCLSLENSEMWQIIISYFWDNYESFQPPNFVAKIQLKNSNLLKELFMELQIQDIGPEMYKMKGIILQYFDNLSDIRYIESIDPSTLDTAVELLQVILTRSKLKDGSMFKDTKEAIDTINAYIYFQLVVKKKFYVSQVDLARLMVIYESGPFPESIKDSIRVVIREILQGCMRSNFIITESREQCSRPRQCIRCILLDLQKQLRKTNRNISCQKAIREFLRSLSEYNSALSSN